jgi:hypothetical protein
LLEAPYKVTLKAYGQALLELARRRPEIVCLGLVSQTITRIAELKELYHLTVLMAEQNFNQAIRIAIAATLSCMARSHWPPIALRSCATTIW